MHLLCLYTNCYYQQNIMGFVKLINVTQSTVNGFKLGTYSLYTGIVMLKHIGVK